MGVSLSTDKEYRQKISYCDIFLLFRVVEIHRIDEATATPDKEGANLSEAAFAVQIEQ